MTAGRPGAGGGARPSPPVRLTVNGERRDIPVDPDAPLLLVLRNDLGLNAAKFGCGQGLCGACTVLVDGRPVTSCDLPVAAVGDRPVETVEGLDAGGRLDRLVEAFVAEGAGQCGYCLAGILVTARALLDRDPAPDDAAIRAALEPNLCRCGIQGRAVRAVRRAAATASRPNVDAGA